VELYRLRSVPYPDVYKRQALNCVKM